MVANRSTTQSERFVMSDTKKMSEVQEYGYTGEDEFKSWASKAKFPATKVEHDFGFDFLCQVVGEPTSGKKSYSMTGHVFMVSVRSTTKSGDSIKINRADADLLLTNDHCVLAIVKRAPLGEAGQVAIKFIDENFIKELHDFLRSGDEDLGVEFSKACSELTAIRYNVDRMFKADYQNRLDLLKKKLKLEEVLKSPSLRIVQDGEGAYSLIRCLNALDPV